MGGRMPEEQEMPVVPGIAISNGSGVMIPQEIPASGRTAL
jgi:hypothetical protein